MGPFTLVFGYVALVFFLLFLWGVWQKRGEMKGVGWFLFLAIVFAVLALGVYLVSRRAEEQPPSETETQQVETTVSGDTG